jgi:predicted transport protein
MFWSEAFHYEIPSDTIILEVGGIMEIYSSENGKLNYVDGIEFKLEKDIQRLCENNLKKLFDLQVVTSEFILQNLRIDTLAFDSKAKSFVVIEYKKDKNLSVIDQGFSYLSVVLNNKADCILEYNENNKSPMKKDDIDWTQTRVMFIAPAFTQFQIQSINFKDLPIELWEIRKYANDTVSFLQIQSSRVAESIKTISSKNKTIEGVSKEIKVFTEDDHLSIASDVIRELYEQLRVSLLGIGGQIKVKPNKMYIGFIAKTNFVDVHVQKKALKLWLNLKIGELNDPQHIARDMSSIGKWGNGDYELQISNDENLDYVLGLAKQSYKKNSQ